MTVFSTLIPAAIGNPGIHGSPPTIAITSPAESKTYGTTVEVCAIASPGRYTVSNTETISSVNCFLDGKQVITLYGSISDYGSQFFVYELINVSLGSHVVMLTCMSSWGNSASAQTRFDVSNSSTFADSWRVLPGTPAVDNAFVVNGTIYSFEDKGIIYNYMKNPGMNLTSYNPATGVRTRQGCAWVNASTENVACVGGVAYVMENYFDRKYNYAFDLATSTWQRKTPMPAETHSELRLTAIDGRIYAVGWTWVLVSSQGYSFVFSNPFWVYDPQFDSWQELPSVPTVVNDFTFSSLDGKVYIIGGYTRGNPAGTQDIPVQLMQIFDTKTNRWSQTTTPTYIPSAAGCSSDTPKRIYLVGSNQTLIYNPDEQSWSKGAPNPTRDTPSAVVNVNDKLYAFGGNYGTDLRYVPFERPAPSPSPTVQPEQTSTPSPNIQPTSTAQNNSPTPPIPEIPSWSILALVVTVVAAGAVRLRKKKSS